MLLVRTGMPYSCTLAPLSDGLLTLFRRLIGKGITSIMAEELVLLFATEILFPFAMVFLTANFYHFSYDTCTLNPLKKFCLLQFSTDFFYHYQDNTCSQ
jgi:hypothetical protein